MSGRFAHTRRSERGASLAAALLLFLVCSVLSAVILAAGTAASGRVSELSAMDARYFSVTSAARVFKREFDGRAVQVVRRKISTVEVRTAYDAEGNEGAPVSSEPVVRYENEAYYLDAKGNPTALAAGSVAGDPFADLALTAAFGQSNVPASGSEEVWAREVKTAGAQDAKQLALSVSGQPGLSVRASCTRDFGTGRLSMVLSNSDAAPAEGAGAEGSAAAADAYEFPIVFDADIQEDEDSSERSLEYRAQNGLAGTTVIETLETVETKTATFTWSVSAFGTGEDA